MIGVADERAHEKLPHGDPKRIPSTRVGESPYEEHNERGFVPSGLATDLKEQKYVTENTLENRDYLDKPLEGMKKPKEGQKGRNSFCTIR